VIEQEESQVFSPQILSEDKDGKLWVSVNERIYTFEGERFLEKEVERENHENKIKALNNKNGALLTHNHEIFKTFEGKIYSVIDLDGVIENAAVDVVEYPKNSGVYFIATSGDGVIKYERGEFSTHTSPDLLPYNEIWDLHIDNDERLWIMGFGGIGLWNGEEILGLELFKEDRNLQYNSMLDDNEGNYWFGSRGNGLYKYRPSQITNIDADDGLKNQKLLSLTALENGNYLFSTNCGGVFEWNHSTAVVPPVNDYLPNKCNWSVYEDSKNRIWFGSRVLYRSNSLNEQGMLIDTTQGFKGIDIFAITEDSENTLWIGALNGLFKFDESSFHRYSTQDGLSYNDVRVIYEDSKGILWIGTSAGLNKMEEGRIEQVFLTNSATNQQAPYIRAVYEDADGVLWFGSYGNGIYRMEGDNIDNITSSEGLFDDVVSHIAEDAHGHFWMGSNRGISRVSKQEINAFIDGSLPSISSVSFGLNDGMNTVETNGGFQPSVIQSEDGKFYFPTVSGVAVVSTNEINPVEKAPPVLIEQVKNSIGDLGTPQHIELSHDDAFLEVRFTALNFSNPDKVQFRYKLNGLNQNWINIDNQRRLLFTKIPPGTYSLQISASISNDVWSTEEASISIEVIPPFWRTPWFFGMLIMSFLALIGYIYRRRTNYLEAKSERQRQFTEQLIRSQEIERKRIANELHDGLGQQILAIKNRVELLKLNTNGNKEVSDQLDEIIVGTQQSISDVRGIAHGLRPVLLEKFGLTKALENLGEELLQISPIEWSYFVDNIDGIIDSEKEINVYRIIQEAINNVEKHSSAKEAALFIQIQKTDRLLITIWDDGKGFNTLAVRKTDGMGFLGMKERVETLNGELQIHSSVYEGTTIKFIIPIIINAD
jgi:signal transduction histidine kinase/ligand-binding sensor domain-containing protein